MWFAILTDGVFEFSVLVKYSQPIFYTEAPVKLPSIWALRFSLNNKYIVTAGGKGEIDVIERFFSTWNVLIQSF